MKQCYMPISRISNRHNAFEYLLCAEPSEAELKKKNGRNLVKSERKDIPVGRKGLCKSMEVGMIN